MLGNKLFVFDGPANQTLKVVVDEFKDDVLDEFAILVFGVEEVLGGMGGYLNLDYVFALFDHLQNLVLSAELIADLFDSFEGDPFAVFAVFGLEDVAWVGGGVPKQPEPITLRML